MDKTNAKGQNNSKAIMDVVAQAHYVYDHRYVLDASLSGSAASILEPGQYGGMLIECALALISVCAVGYIWNQYADGTTTTPTVVFATGLASMFSKVFGLSLIHIYP